MARFPEAEWIEALMKKLNTDTHYAEVASKWEGDMLFKIEPGGNLSSLRIFYLDLWHGNCRQAFMVSPEQDYTATFTLTGSYENYTRLLRNELEPMQALLTRKLGIRGNMGILMRNVPTVLDFVRCCREITTEIL